MAINEKITMAMVVKGFISSLRDGHACGSLRHGRDAHAHGVRALPYVHGPAQGTPPCHRAHVSVLGGAHGHVDVHARVSCHHGHVRACAHDGARDHVNACAHVFLSQVLLISF